MQFVKIHIAERGDRAKSTSFEQRGTGAYTLTIREFTAKKLSDERQEP